MHMHMQPHMQQPFKTYQELQTYMSKPTTLTQLSNPLNVYKNLNTD